MDEIVQKIRKLPRYTSPNGTLYPAHDGELIEVGAVISLLRNHANNTIDDKKVLEIADKCADLNLYDDDDFTPPESVPDFSDEDFWDWVQELLRASARNALGMLQDEQ